jgi:hypothetical protein
MENSVIIRMEMDIQAQKLISQYMIANEHLEKKLEAGIKNAFEKFDFQAAVEVTVTDCIQNAIRKSGDWGRISTLVQEKANEVIDGYVERAINRMKGNLKNDFKEE